MTMQMQDQGAASSTVPALKHRPRSQPSIKAGDQRKISTMAIHSKAETHTPSIMAAATLKRWWERNAGRKSSNAGGQGAAVLLIISDILDCFCWRQDNTVEQRRTLKLQANLLDIRVMYRSWSMAAPNVAQRA